MPARTPAELRSATSICQLFQDTAAAHPQRVALRAVGRGGSLTWAQYATRVRSITAGLAALGVRRGDTVALMLTNRPEFNLIDAAAYHLGAIPFSVYNTSSADQINYLFGNAENRVVVCEQQFLPVLSEAKAATKVEHVVCVDAKPAGVLTLDELEAAGDAGFDFDATWLAVRPDDVLTLIYTSGTTGPPKGVELTHRNLLTNIAALADLVVFDEHDRVVSYLPDAHIVNRYLAHYAPAVSGASVTTVADHKALVSALPDARPTIFAAVPLFWYKIQAALQAGLAEQRGIKGALARWAVAAGAQKALVQTRNERPSAWIAMQAAAAEQLVLRRLRARVGLDQVRIAVSGAAPIAAETLEFVLGLGLPVCEAWGMSELSAVATLNPPDGIRVGTVGKPVAGVQLRVADDGELLVRGPGLMKGYRNDPEKTAQAIDADGWMHTGDVGTVDADGYVRIVDRKKELIINSGGKNIAPSNIENHVRAACPLIGSVVAIGDDRPCIVALVSLDADAAARYARQLGIDASPAVLAIHPDVRAAVQAGIDSANAKLSRVEQIKYFHIAPTFWQPGGDELTPTAKLKRKPIAGKYAAEIEQLYANIRKA
ncbi:AMP-dependent synthetase/ligase [Mycobacterium branderi]|uniref:Acyl-CoA synthetase n=1 Tax=Mycobacterium branderi TaxID=43348 RepID=A0AA91RHH8_9MYCO|nr:AMP-dependent synthetase/ligase [Mycobacterium branderi]MCV7232399.1 AMP-binding protein [Mycobacterium branderi]ORA36033.1 long-chain fatty acid--CoA ligase [Mycobacterium branderi]